MEGMDGREIQIDEKENRRKGRGKEDGKKINIEVNDMRRQGRKYTGNT